MSVYFILIPHLVPSTSVMVFLDGSAIKNPPANAGDRVLSLGWEDPLEKEMVTHSSILAWEIPWTEEPGGGYNPWGRKESDTTVRLTRTSIALNSKSWIISPNT